MTRSLARPTALISGIAKGSLSRYADELFRQLDQGWPLTLADYVRVEEVLSASSPSQPKTTVGAFSFAPEPQRSRSAAETALAGGLMDARLEL